MPCLPSGRVNGIGNAACLADRATDCVLRHCLGVAGLRSPSAKALMFLALPFLAFQAHAEDRTLHKPAAIPLCQAFGAGFVPIPGGDSCIRLSGRFTYDLSARWTDGVQDGHAMASRARLGIDTTTATAFGPLRSVIALSIKQPNAPVADDDDDVASASTASLSRAYINWFGLTAGLTQSFFDGKAIRGFSGALASSKALPLLGYTAYLGRGAYAAIAVEDAKNRASASPLAGDTDRFVGQLPDLVGKAGYEGNGLTAEFSGAVRHLEWRLPKPEETFGFALQASLAFDAGNEISALERLSGLDRASARHRFSFNAAYAQGATSYLGLSSKLPDVGCDPASGQCDLVSGFSLSAGYQLNLNPHWSSNLVGSVARLDTMDGRDPSHFWQASANLVYKPVRNLQLGAELAVAGSLDGAIGASQIVTFTPRLRLQAGF
jgi:hypothetical protein